MFIALTGINLHRGSDERTIKVRYLKFESVSARPNRAGGRVASQL